MFREKRKNYLLIFLLIFAKAIIFLDFILWLETNPGNRSLIVCLDSTYNWCEIILFFTSFIYLLSEIFYIRSDYVFKLFGMVLNFFLVFDIGYNVLDYIGIHGTHNLYQYILDSQIWIVFLIAVLYLIYFFNTNYNCVCITKNYYFKLTLYFNYFPFLYNFHELLYYDFLGMKINEHINLLYTSNHYLNIAIYVFCFWLNSILVYKFLLWKKCIVKHNINIVKVKIKKKNYLSVWSYRIALFFIPILILYNTVFWNLRNYDFNNYCNYNSAWLGWEEFINFELTGLMFICFVYIFKLRNENNIKYKILYYMSLIVFMNIIGLVFFIKWLINEKMLHKLWK